MLYWSHIRYHTMEQSYTTVLPIFVLSTSSLKSSQSKVSLVLCPIFKCTEAKVVLILSNAWWCIIKNDNTQSCRKINVSLRVKYSNHHIVVVCLHYSGCKPVYLESPKIWTINCSVKSWVMAKKMFYKVTMMLTFDLGPPRVQMVAGTKVASLCCKMWPHQSGQEADAGTI